MHEEVDFAPLRREDLPLLSHWLADPDVHRWWPDPYDLATLEQQYGPRVDGVDPTEVFTILVDGRPVGLIQRYLTRDEPEWLRVLGAADPAIARRSTGGIDYLIGQADLRGRGLGSRVIARFTDRFLAEVAAIEAVVAAVQQENRASWRALEKAGYRRLWAGRLASTDPSDAGPAYLLIRERHDPPG